MDRKYTGTKGAEKRLGKRAEVQAPPRPKVVRELKRPAGSDSAGAVERRPPQDTSQPSRPTGACSLHGEKKCKKTMMCGLETEAS